MSAPFPKVPAQPHARRAADRLREATDLLGGLQQQDAAGRLGLDGANGRVNWPPGKNSKPIMCAT